MKEKFLFSRKIGNHLHFHCVKKETLNCEIKARLLDDHGKLTLTELGWNHNQDPQGNEEVIRREGFSQKCEGSDPSGYVYVYGNLE